MFNNKRYEELLEEWYKYKDFCCLEHTHEYIKLRNELKDLIGLDKCFLHEKRILMNKLPDFLKEMYGMI